MPAYANVSCIGCSRQLRLPTDIIGSSVRCPMCQAEFHTISVGEGEARAVPFATPGNPGALVPDLVDAPSGQPYRSMSLDDNDPAPTPPVPAPIPEQTETPRRTPLPAESFPTIRFVVFIQNDPRERLEGRFQAKIAPEGLSIWRGNGRVINVSPGAKARHERGARLSLEIEGRMVALTVIHDRHAATLAGQIADFLTGTATRVELPSSAVWPLVPLALLPIGVPILARMFGDRIAGPVGIFAWSLVALIAVAAALGFAYQRSWAISGKSIMAGLMVALAYLAFGVGLAIDRAMGPSRIPASAWRTFSQPNDGYALNLPGQPTRRPLRHPLLQEDGNDWHLAPKSTIITYRVVSGRFGGKGGLDDGPGMLERRRDEAIDAFVQDGLAFRVIRRTRLPSPSPGVEAMECELAGGPGGSAQRGIARVYVSPSRLLVLKATSTQHPPTHPDITRFITSVRITAQPKKDDRDGPGKDGPWKDMPPKEMPWKDRNLKEK